MFPFCPPVGDFPHWSHKKVLFWPFNKSLVDQACSVKMAGYWPSSFFFCVLVTTTSPRSIKMQKKNSSNVQPS